jgi:hypothetical protein
MTTDSATDLLESEVSQPTVQPHTRLWLATIYVGNPTQQADEPQEVRTQKVLVADVALGKEEVTRLAQDFAKQQYPTARVEKVVEITCGSDLFANIDTLNLPANEQMAGVPQDARPVQLIVEVAYLDFDPLSQEAASRMESLLFPSRKAAKEVQTAIEEYLDKTYPDECIFIHVWIAEDNVNAADIKTAEEGIRFMDWMVYLMDGRDVDRYDPAIDWRGRRMDDSPAGKLEVQNMSDRFSLGLSIGGPIPRKLVPLLCRAMVFSHARLHCDDDPFEPESEEDLLKGLDESGRLTLHYEQDQYTLGGLEDTLRKYGIQFDRRCDSSDEWNGEIVVHRGPGREYTFTTTEDGEPLVPLAAVVKVKAALRAGDSAAALATLAEAAPELPELPALVFTDHEVTIVPDDEDEDE